MDGNRIIAIVAGTVAAIILIAMVTGLLPWPLSTLALIFLLVGWAAGRFPIIAIPFWGRALMVAMSAVVLMSWVAVKHPLLANAMSDRSRRTINWITDLVDTDATPVAEEKSYTSLGGQLALREAHVVKCLAVLDKKTAEGQLWDSADYAMKKACDAEAAEIRLIKAENPLVPGKTRTPPPAGSARNYGGGKMVSMGSIDPEDVIRIKEVGVYDLHVGLKPLQFVSLPDFRLTWTLTAPMEITFGDGRTFVDRPGSMQYVPADAGDNRIIRVKALDPKGGEFILTATKRG